MDIFDILSILMVLIVAIYELVRKKPVTLGLAITVFFLGKGLAQEYGFKVIGCIAVIWLISEIVSQKSKDEFEESEKREKELIKKNPFHGKSTAELLEEVQRRKTE